MNNYPPGGSNAQSGIQTKILKAHFSFINSLLSASQQDPLYFTGQISAQERWQEKKSAVELCSHDATLPVTTSAPVFHLWLLLVWSCHVRRRIRASFPPLSPPFLPVPGVGRVAGPVQRRVHRERGGERHSTENSLGIKVINFPLSRAATQTEIKSA